jgi:Protein of unknown function (DUF4241)
MLCMPIPHVRSDLVNVPGAFSRTVSRKGTLSVELLAAALWNAFADGARVMRNDVSDPDVVRTIDAGVLSLPTGRIVISDPFLDPWNDTLSVRVPPGNYPVLLSIIRDDVALVMVVLGNGKPASWQPADPPYFSVDSATGCLMDHKVCRFLHRKAEADRYDRYTDRFRDALDANDGLSATCCIDTESGANIVLFRTWGGDGRFPSFFGYDPSGSVACLVTDMYLSMDVVDAVVLPD